MDQQKSLPTASIPAAFTLRNVSTMTVSFSKAVNLVLICCRVSMASMKCESLGNSKGIIFS